MSTITVHCVIPVPLVMFDHRILRLTLDGDRLADILNRQSVGAPSFAG
ncbi:hypothetical protein ACWD4V_21975 [Streptomyces tsukubensis]